MIWVVTDHPHTRRSLADLIAAKGYTVTEIECGDELLKTIRFRPPRLVILDCGFPDSFNLLTAIRADAASRQVPVIMFSIDDQNLSDKSLRAGASAYVPKGSLDWADLQVEIVRFAGPPPGAP